MDASHSALGWVLSQMIDIGLQPVGFHSQKFSLAKLNYKIHDRELLVLMTGFKQWTRYEEGNQLPAIVFTYHKNLNLLMTEARQLNRRQARWAAFMAVFEF